MNLSIFNSKLRLIFKVIAFLLAFFLIEYGIEFYLEKKNQNPSFRIGKRLLTQIKGEHIENAQLIVVGDSSCNAGIDTDILKKITGYKTLKLAPPARYAQMSGYYFLKEYLRHNPPPKILLDIRTPSLMSRNWSPELFFDNFFNIQDTIQMIVSGIIDWNDFFFSYFPNIISSYRNRYALKRLFGEDLHWLKYFNHPIFTDEYKNGSKQNRSPISRKLKTKMNSYFLVTRKFSKVFSKHLIAETNWLAGIENNNSFIHGKKKLSDRQQIFKIGMAEYHIDDVQYKNGLKPLNVANSYFGRLRLFYQIIENKEMVVTRVDRFYLQKMKELCARNNIRFFFCPGPLFEGLYQHKIGKAFFDKAINEFQEIAAQEPMSETLIDEMLLFPLTMFTNSTEHLNAEGMKLYSEKVGAALINADRSSPQNVE